ncbi:hypothetical protein [Ruegeria lacuscaerulensis]|uniref:hypothetical protein n=1 Tax=Ruegeria lacuscaerulensis TaxID=55218 RepID=UPI00147B7E27|nr:hypothetical protein [Ruegeria lacuscaerulensis]
MRYLLLLCCVLVVGCDAVRSTTDRVFNRGEPAPKPEEAVVEEVGEPEPAPATAAGWIGAKTTIASLGDPTTPGRWMQTPLVETEFTGRVLVPRTGAQAYITLVPAPGPEGGGSRLSLDAMRELLLPFDELVELEVYSN